MTRILPNRLVPCIYINAFLRVQYLLPVDNTMDIDEDEQRRLRYQAELASYRRFLRCMVFLLVFWFVMLYFLAHHDNGLVIAGIVAICLWIVYMCMCICGEMFLRVRDEKRQEDGDEEAGLTANNRTEASERTAAFPYSFDDTPKRIRACPDSIIPGKSPTNGTYTAVFSAVFFNKALRSEGKLRLEFLQTHKNGWTIQGESNFGRASHVLTDGFVNANGEMYWSTGDSIHRGVLDFATSSMFDGEFIPFGKQFLSKKQGPVGRIVRLELATASFYSSSVEMVSFTPDNAEEDEEHESLFN